MEIYREGKLRNSDLSTGDTLALHLGFGDIENLANPDIGYSMTRFGSFKHTRLGRAMEDKVHIWLRQPDGDEPDLPANLRLDQGGDLYFDIWNTEKLSQAKTVEVFNDLDKFVTSDPSGVIKRLGIESVRIFYLNMLARQLASPEPIF